LPFHRYYTWTYEKLLRDECGFQGAHPYVYVFLSLCLILSPKKNSYWDEPLDAGNFMHSVLLDPNVGFGGNGAGGTSATGEANCVRDGPFASYTAHIGPAYQVTDHCLARTVNEEISKMSSQGSVDACLSQTNFVEVWKCIEYGPHVGGHLGIGGTMVRLPQNE
jgi:tyrosinase